MKPTKEDAMNIARDGVKKQDMYDVLDGICKNCEGRARCPNDWCNEVLYAIRDLIVAVGEWQEILDGWKSRKRPDIDLYALIETIRDFGKERE
jgi:hypothetical protein